MTISRMQQPRQMYQRGGIMEVAPRQGALFGGLKKAVSSALGSTKKILKSPIGKAAALYFAPALIPGGAKTLGGVFQNMGGLSGITSALFANPATYQQKLMGAEKGFFPGLMDKFSNMGKFGKAATMFGIGSLGGGALAALEAAGVEDESQVRDTEALKAYLRQGYKQLNQDASPEQVEAFVTANTTEYAANGGRIGFADGMPREGIETLLPKPKPSEMMQGVDKTIQSIDNFAQLIAQSGSPSDMRGHMDLFSDFIQKNNVDAGPAFQYLKNRVKELKPGMERYIYISNEDMPVQKAMGGRINYEGGGSTDFEKWLEGKQKFDQGQNAEQLYREYLEDKRRQKVAEQKTMAANGGRIGYAFGSPEDNARQASGIMNLPLNQNPAGITELDLRDSGGFIPPVGVKEKADDIPAMLSNNEFVFTADAVRGMGDGDVEKGAQRMYDMMKKLEGGGRV
jgi:hypothetical protein